MGSNSRGVFSTLGPPRRVLIFVDSFTTGGAERQAFELGRRLSEAGHEVEYWAFASNRKSDEFLQAIRSTGAAARIVPDFSIWDWAGLGRGLGFVVTLRLIPRLVREFWAYRQALPSGNFDTVVPFTPRPSLVATLYKGRIGAHRVVWNHRGGDDPGGFPYSSHLVALARKKVDRFIANSEGGAQFLQRTFGLPGTRVTVIRNYLKPSFQSQGRKPETDEGRTLVHVANLYPEKDVETVIRGLARIRHHPAKPRLLIVGRTVSRMHDGALRALVEAEGLANQVAFFGETAPGHVAELLARADVGLLSSRTEGCPNAVLEYMQAGLPVVATDLPSIRGILPEACHGLLFKVGDIEGCSKAMQLALDDPARARQLGLWNREALRAEFDDEVTSRSWAEILA